MITIEEAAENFVNNTRLRNYKSLFIEGAKSEAAKEHWYNEFKKSHEYKVDIRQAFNQGNSLGILGEHKDGSEYLKLIKKK